MKLTSFSGLGWRLMPALLYRHDWRVEDFQEIHRYSHTKEDSVVLFFNYSHLFLVSEHKTGRLLIPTIYAFGG